MNQLTKKSDNLLASAGIEQSNMAPGLAIMFNDQLYDRCTQLARVMANAEGTTPRHLIKKPEACFAVITRAITWKLDPFAVAMSTYQTPGGSIGYEGKLIQAILENSGKIVGGITYRHYGDWSKVKGKFKMNKGQSGKEYPVVDWTHEDAAGLGVTVSAQVEGELEPRTLDFDLDECFPLNSTLWASRPKQQICYTACRAFANIAVPGLLMGIPFDADDTATPAMRDITPDSFQAPADSPASDSLTIEDWKLVGARARRRGDTFRSAPKDLSASDYDDWCAGWQEQDAAMHDATPKETQKAEDDATPKETPKPEGEVPAQAAPEPAPKEEIPDAPRKTEKDRAIEAAFKNGFAKFNAGKSIYAVEPEYKRKGNDHLEEAFKEGWRAAEREANDGQQA